MNKDQDTIDVRRLVGAIRAAELRLRALKRTLRSTWPEGHSMAATQRAWLTQRARATELYALRASARGRLHIICQPRELRGLGDVEESWDARAYNAALADAARGEFSTGRARVPAEPAGRPPGARAPL